MKKILILFAAIFLSIGAYSQDLNKTNLRMMVDKINTKADIDDGTHTGTTEMEDLSITGSISTPTSITTSSISTDALQVGDSANVVSIDDITRIGDSYRIYDDGVQLAPDIPPSAYANLSDYVPLLVDTIPLFVFGGGAGNATDTTIFTTSSIYGSFYNAGSDTLVVTELRCVMGHGIGTDTLSVDILWDVNNNDATPTELNTNPLGILSTTSGTVDTAFANAKIPPGVWVWCETPGVVLGRKPTYFIAQISGYKIPKY